MMNHLQKKQRHRKPVSILILERQTLKDVIGGGSVRITGQDPAPSPDNRDF